LRSIDAGTFGWDMEAGRKDMDDSGRDMSGILRTPRLAKL